MTSQWGGARSARAIEMGQILRELDRSGLRVTEFARQRGIPVSTLRWWRRVRRREAEARPARRRPRPREARPRFLEVVVPSNAGAAEGRRSAGAFEVVLAQGRTVRVPVDFDPAGLQRLLRTLDAPC